MLLSENNIELKKNYGKWFHNENYLLEIFRVIRRCEMFGVLLEIEILLDFSEEMKFDFQLLDKAVSHRPNIFPLNLKKEKKNHKIELFTFDMLKNV